MVAATIDDMQWVEYPADALDDEPMQGWLLRVIGMGQKEREVPLPVEVVGDLTRYLVSRGLEADPQDADIRGRSCSAKPATGRSARRANRGEAHDPRQKYLPVQRTGV